jgi:hypothetical protein
MTTKYSQLMCYSVIDTDIIFAELPANLKIDLAMAKELVADRLDFTKSQKHYIVIDVTNIREITNEAKIFLQRSDTGLKNILGAAFVATNPVSILIANIFIKTKKDFEAMLFSDKESAITWIESQKNIKGN